MSYETTGDLWQDHADAERRQIARAAQRSKQRAQDPSPRIQEHARRREAVTASSEPPALDIAAPGTTVGRVTT